MLISLTIKNIALIDEMHINFGTGFNVLTGETGAGKSIIIDALNLIIGERSDKSLIRSSCDYASVEANISIKNNEDAKKVLYDSKINFDSEIINVYRRISVNGRNVCRISGELVSLSVLKDFMSNLVDILGQHSSSILLDEKKQMYILDEFGDEYHQSLICKVKNKYKLWHQSSVNLKKLIQLNKEKELFFDKTQKQLNELDSANIQLNEEEELIKKRESISSQIKINDALKNSYYNLYGFSDGDSILQKLQECVQAFDTIKDIDETYNKLYKSLSNCYYELENDFIDIRELRDNQDFDENQETKIDERLELIKRIKRRFGPSVQDIVKNHGLLQNKMDEYIKLDTKIKSAELDFKNKLNDYRKDSIELTSSRQKLAVLFENNITEQLHTLGMKNAVFHVSLEQDIKLKPKELGNDTVIFQFSSNVGEPMKAVVDSASGGELSRIMLALKTIESEKNKIPCLIFDEVDTGISGNAAQIVAEKIAIIAKNRQVFAVSHLAQIACMADTHFFVSKNERTNRTITSIELLNEKQRQFEIARLLGILRGNEESALVHANNLLRSAEDYKIKL